jgi:hypothetical protein
VWVCIRDRIFAPDASVSSVPAQRHEWCIRHWQATGSLVSRYCSAHPSDRPSVHARSAMMQSISPEHRTAAGRDGGQTICVRAHVQHREGSGGCCRRTESYTLSSCTHYTTALRSHYSRAPLPIQQYSAVRSSHDTCRAGYTAPLQNAMTVLAGYTRTVARASGEMDRE